MNSASGEVLETLVSQLRAHVPTIAKYLDSDCSVENYSKKLRSKAGNKTVNARQDSILTSVQEICNRTFGETKAKGIELADVQFLNIVDHHQLLNHPLLLGTNIIANASELFREAEGRVIVTLSCSNVTPSNSYMQFGFRFCGRTIPYFSAKEYQDSIAYVRCRKYDFVERLQRLKRWDQFQDNEQEFLAKYQQFLNDLDYSRCLSHSDQIAMGVESCWPLLFESQLRSSLPSLYYVNAEELTGICLCRLLVDENFISEAILNSEFRTLVLERFRGVVTAWDEARLKGTHFFWRRVPGAAKLLRMYVQGNELVPTDVRYKALRVPLERSAIIDHLQRRDILPSVTLTASVLLRAGITPLVGPGSLIYYSMLREFWIHLLSNAGFDSDAECIREVQVEGLVAGAPLFFAKENGQLKTLYAADAIARGGVSKEYMRALLSRRFGDVLAVGCVDYYELYRPYIPHDKWIHNRITMDQAATIVYGDTLNV